MVFLLLKNFLLDETGMLVGLVSHRPDSQFIRSQIFDKDGKERNMVRNVVRVKSFFMFKKILLDVLSLERR